MIRRPRHVRLSATAGVAGNDTDALQTDVMRFMSIIGLCLMAVFALVQAIPVQEQDRASGVAQSTRLREVIQTQLTQIEQLQAGLHTLRSLSGRAEQRVVDAQAQSRSLDSELVQLRTERDQLAPSLMQLERDLIQARTSLDALQVHSTRQADQLAGLEARLQDTQQQLDASREQLVRLQSAARQARLDRQPEQPAPVERLAKQPVTPPVTRPVVPARDRVSDPLTEPGFSLRFSSDDALDRLIASGAVSLYAMTTAQTWRATFQGEQTVIVAADKPRWFHEMANRTVPAHYQGGIDAVRGESNEAVTWGVQLPQATRDAIRERMQDRKGGALVIHANGTVSVEG